MKPWREKRPAGMSRIVWRWLVPLLRSMHYEQQRVQP